MLNSTNHHLKPNTDLGEYIIEKVIATGGMGDIYKAKEKSLGRPVVIKTIKHDLLNQVKIEERFHNEAKIIAQLNHPNIVIIHSFVQGHDIGKEFDYIVLEYIDGKTLQEVIEQGPLPVEPSIQIMKQILQGLKVAHNKEVLHRDIKPANIMIDQNKHIKILDFGLAKSIDLSHDSFTTAGTIMGTTYYLSPEVAVGKKPIKASDIYSAGIVFFELLTGQLPFKADTPLGTIEKIKTEQLPLPEKVNPQIPSYLSNIIYKMCQKNPADRYEKIEDIIHDLENQSQTATKPRQAEATDSIQYQTTQKITSMGFDPTEVDDIMDIARNLQKEKENKIGQSTIISIGEELHLDEDIIRQAAKQLKEKNKNASNSFIDKEFPFKNDNTPEDQNDPDQYEIAYQSSRIFAVLVDYIIISLIGVSTFGLGMLFYVPICHHFLKGQTLGQKINNIKTITTDNKPLTLEKSLIDSIGMIFLPFDIIIGLFCSKKTKHFQRFMQTIANTAVVAAK